MTENAGVPYPAEDVVAGADNVDSIEIVGFLSHTFEHRPSVTSRTIRSSDKSKVGFTSADAWIYVGGTSDRPVATRTPERQVSAIG